MTTPRIIKIRCTAFAMLSLLALWTALTGIWWTRTSMAYESFLQLIFLAILLLCLAMIGSSIFSKVLFVLGIFFMVGGVFLAPAFHSIDLAGAIMSAMVLSGTGFIWVET